MARILVVDDEIGIRELLSEILYDEGHTVDLAENAVQARNLRQANPPDLVLLDIWMPDTDGVTLLREWASGGWLTMPVVMMSGHATIDTAVEATRIGAVDFLEKPITLQKLLHTVEQALERGKAQKRLSLVRGGLSPAPSNGAASAALYSLPSAATPAARVVSPPALAAAGAHETLTAAETSAPNAGFGANVATLAPAGAFVAVRDLPLDLPLREARDAFERVYFAYHLARENNSMTRVADKTGLERTHLYRKLKQLGIELAKRRSS